MGRRASRTFLVFAAVTLLLAGYFFSSSGLQQVAFEPHLPLSHVGGEQKDSSTPEAPQRIPDTKFHDPYAKPGLPYSHLVNEHKTSSAIPSSSSVPPQKSSYTDVDSPSSKSDKAHTFFHGLETATEKAKTTVRPSKSSPKTTVVVSSAPRPTRRPQPNGASSKHSLNGTQSLLVEITETNGWHDEVVAALVHSLGSQKNVKLGVYQKNSRFGMADILKDFNLSHPLPSVQSPDVFKNAPENSSSPAIVVATTCETDVLYLSTRMNALLAQGSTFLFCIVHHADRWQSEELEAALSPWIERDRIDFITLSPHTASYLRTHGLRDWSARISRPIKSFAPVFPVRLPAPPPENDTRWERELSFALQGNYEPSRRNFNGIFSSLKSLIERPIAEEDEAITHSNVSLHLLGSGERPQVPTDLKGHVHFDEGLSYREFYKLLSKTFALLPAFANDEYLDRKASSSVPASLLGATPLVATNEILAAYTYLPREAVYLREPGESELDVIGRVLELSSLARYTKMTKVRRSCAKLVAGNVKLFKHWVDDAISKIDQ